MPQTKKTSPRAGRSYEDPAFVAAHDSVVERPLDTPEETDPISRIEEVLDRLGDKERMYASVYLVRDDGDEVFLEGKVFLGAQEDPMVLVERVREKHGGGHFRMQLRAPGERGTVGNTSIKIAGPSKYDANGCPVEPSVASSAPPAPGASDDAMIALLSKQNEQLFGFMREALAKPATPSPATSMQEQMGMLAMMFKFARGLSRAAGETELPGWMETIGKVVAPVIATVAENMQKPKAPPPPHQGPRKPVENVAGAAATAGAGPAPPAPIAAATADQDDQDEDEEPSTVELVLEGVLAAAADEANPDPDTYAAIIWKVAAPEFTEIAKLAPVGGIATAAVDQVPALKGKEAFCQKLETALRAKVAPAPNGVTNGPAQ